MTNLRIRFEGQGAEAAALALAAAVAEAAGQAPSVGQVHPPAPGREVRALGIPELAFYVTLGDLILNLGLALPKLAELARHIQAKAREIAEKDGLRATYEVNGRVVDLATITQEELLNIYLGTRHER